ncbi:hypothetical protein Q9L58_007562 [Maublancomyces gigas]|uniref:CFEM domain-containing protein n=1 Tax=Discina gigas TaxID=1032678 RepID=A0ABR3GC95_9PEZI
MRYGFLAIAFALVVTVVLAQLDITAFPDCATKCCIDSIAGTGCALTDYGCMCQNGGLFQLLVPCVSGACSSKADQQKTYSLFQSGCNSYHVVPPLPSSLLTPTTTTTTSGGSSSTSTSASSTSTSSTPVIFDLASIPSCAANCAISAITSTLCPPTDYKCCCESSNFVDNLAPCVAMACSESDQQKMFDLSRDLCSANGVSVTIIPPTSNIGGNHGTTSTPTSTTPGTTFRATTPTPTATRTSSSTRASSTTAGAAKIAGPGFVAAAAMGAAFFVF